MSSFLSLSQPLFFSYYEIRVKAKDIWGYESDWSDPLPVSMPKTYENTLLVLLENLNEWFASTFGREILPRIFNL